MTDEILEKTLSDLGVSFDGLYEMCGQAMSLGNGESIQVQLGERSLFMDNHFRFFRDDTLKSQVYFSLSRMISSHMEL